MEYQPTIVVGALLVVGVVGLYIAIARLVRADAPRLGELNAVRDERDRLQSALREAQEAARIEAERAGKLDGRLISKEREHSEAIRKLDELSRQGSELRTELEAKKLEAGTAQAAVSDRDANMDRLTDALASKEGELEKLRQRFTTVSEENAKLSANLTHLQSAADEIKAFVNDAHSKLTAEVAELASKTFQEHAKALQENIQGSHTRSRADIELLLKPFSERLADFRQRIDTLYSNEAQERSALMGAVNELKTLNQNMADTTAAMTRALKGSAKVRGDWGELMLDNVLRGSGLEEGNHYERQKVTSDDEGNRLQPDVVVKLPDGRLVVVDSKVNLIAWQEAMNAESPEGHQDALRRHAVALRQHIKDLGDKNYPKAIGEGALEMTIAFIPIEGALSAALGFDQTLQTEAFDRGVVFASPNTLMALLRVVERLWTRDKIQRQTLEISSGGGKVLDALSRFLEQFDLVGRRVTDASQAFAAARKALSESPQSLIPRARRLVELGVRGKRSLPEELVPDSVEDSEELPGPLSTADATIKTTPA